MSLSAMIKDAFRQGASDLHLEPGMPPAMRVRGALRIAGDPIAGQTLLGMAQQAASPEQWESFYTRRSVDLSRSIGGVRCRLNIFQTARGVGMAIRMFTSFTASLEELNLHPSLRELTGRRHGLILVSGPTGSGKSSTTAALIQEINRREARHILTIEQPIEFNLRSRRSLIRQREVGRDTPSFEQALVDALREDPDVILVGEMRRPETMRLTLSAAETGHLVLTTVHSATVVEALQRIIASFPPEGQAAVCAQLADSLVAVVSQHLVWYPRAGVRVPELEILTRNTAVQASIRANQLHRLQGILETGKADGMWSRDRYRRWIQERPRFHVPRPSEQTDAEEAAAPVPPAPSALGAMPTKPAGVRARPARSKPASTPVSDDGVFVLDGADQDPASILAGLVKDPAKDR
ncbi:MAG: PilT/PilU family type 4a pilus ATPase [Myxococcota bacterium]